MHIAFVFSGTLLTDKEIRLVRAAHELQGVSLVTVISMPVRTGLLVSAERLRARVERMIARQSLHCESRDVLASVATLVALTSYAELSLLSTPVDRLVNLSGASSETGAVVANFSLDLEWDGIRPEGLGQLRAKGMPPRELIVRCSAKSGAEGIVQQSTLTLTPATPAGDRRNAASRSLVLLLRALRLSDAELNARCVHSRAKGQTQEHSSPIGALVGSMSVASAAVFRRASRQLWRDDAWEILYRTDHTSFAANTDRVTSRGFRPYRAGYDRFIADPIPFSHGGARAVFFEEFPFATLKGVISCALLEANGELGQPRVVLERPYHLSYPFVFRDGERVYMIPETSANRTVDLYECTKFPFTWEFRKTLLSNISANDATLHHAGERWWMFATVSDEGAYAWDELHLFSAPSILGEWTPHLANPVKCDARSARPAGPLFWRAGRLIRPTQDCSQSYGGAVNLCEIEVLSPTEFREHIIERLDPVSLLGMQGLHTLASTDGLEVVDARPGKRMRWEAGNMRAAAGTQ